MFWFLPWDWFFKHLYYKLFIRALKSRWFMKKYFIYHCSFRYLQTPDGVTLHWIDQFDGVSRHWRSSHISPKRDYQKFRHAVWKKFVRLSQKMLFWQSKTSLKLHILRLFGQPKFLYSHIMHSIWSGSKTRQKKGLA